jgi:steroid delta-isomerase-like uncharacterized protein
MNCRSIVAALALAASMLLMPAAHAAGVAGEIVKAYVTAWNEHDIDKAVSWFTDDVTYFDASVGTAVVGKADANAKVVASFINAAPDCKWQMLGEPIVDGDMVAFQWRFTGTNTGAWADGTEAANKPFDFIGATVIETKGGKIWKQSDYYDALGFYKQLGWM